MKKENQPGNYQLKADLEGNYLIDKEHKATKRLGICLLYTSDAADEL